MDLRFQAFHHRQITIELLFSFWGKAEVPAMRTIGGAIRIMLHDELRQGLQDGFQRRMALPFAVHRFAATAATLGCGVPQLGAGLAEESSGSVECGQSGAECQTAAMQGSGKHALDEQLTEKLLLVRRL